MHNQLYGARNTSGVVNPIFIEQEDNGYLDCHPEPQEGLYSDMGKSPYVFSNPLYGGNANVQYEDEPEGGYDEIRPVGQSAYGGQESGYLDMAPKENANGYLDMGPLDSPEEDQDNMYAEYDTPTPYQHQQPVYEVGDGEAHDVYYDNEYLPAE